MLEMKYEKIPFDEKEMETEKRESSFMGDIVTFDYPITPKENYIRNVHNCAVWQPTTNDYLMFSPNLIADNVARGLCWEEEELSPEQWGGKDMFGVEWEYIEVAEGSMVKPGNPMLEDANDWKSVIHFPDVDSWDWEDTAKRNIPWLKAQEGMVVQTTILTGYFERLISFMDFEEAAVAMIDEEQKDAVKELFEALTDLYIKIVDKLAEYFPGQIDEICVHDDWGAQRSPFFSESVVREMLMPPMKRLVDHIHAKGYLSMFHCCGKVDTLVPIMVELGWQSWDAMDICDIETIYRTYGDKLKVTVSPVTPPTGASEEEYEKAAKEFADMYCNIGKGCVVSRWYNPVDADFQSALYKASRLAFSK